MRNNTTKCHANCCAHIREAVNLAMIFANVSTALSLVWSESIWHWSLHVNAGFRDMNNGSLCEVDFSFGFVSDFRVKRGEARAVGDGFLIPLQGDDDICFAL